MEEEASGGLLGLGKAHSPEGVRLGGWNCIPESKFLLWFYG